MMSQSEAGVRRIAFEVRDDEPKAAPAPAWRPKVPVRATMTRELFLSMVEQHNSRSNSHWLLTNGQRHCTVGGRVMTVARTAFTLLIGPVPDNKSVGRTCRKYGCVRPEHLRLINYKPNPTEARLALSRKRSAAPPPARTAARPVRAFTVYVEENIDAATLRSLTSTLSVLRGVKRVEEGVGEAAAPPVLTRDAVINYLRHNLKDT
jgi:hypothetical protein